MNSEDQVQNEQLNEWIPLSEAARFTPYSADYLSLLARKKRLVAKKIDGIWYTTRAILTSYLAQQVRRAEALNQNPENYLPFIDLSEEVQDEVTSTPSGEKFEAPASVYETTPPAEQRDRRESDVGKDLLMEEFMRRFNAHIDRQMDAQHGWLFKLTRFVRNSYRYTVWSAKFPLFIVSLVLIVILPLRFVSGFADNFFQSTVDAVKNAQTVMGFRPGTHENEILLLGPEGEIAIFGNVETEGQFRSYVEDGIAPITVKSTTKVDNLNVDMLDGVSAQGFTLAYVTKNGNVTYEPVFLEGSVEVGQTLLVKGATKMLDSLRVDGDLSVFGEANFAKGISVSGPSVFKDLITAPSVIVSDLLRAHRLVVESDLDVEGSISATSGRINGNFYVEETFRAGGNVSLGADGYTVRITSEEWSVDNDGNATFQDLIAQGDTNLAGLTVGGNADFSGAVTLDGALNDASGSAGTIGYILQSTGTSTQWVATSSLGIVGGGGGGGNIASLNGQTGANQTFATGTATGIGLTITSSGDVHTFTPTMSAGYNIPLTASTTEWSNNGSLINLLDSASSTWNNTSSLVTASSTEWSNAYTLANLLNFASSTWNAAYASTTAMTPSYLRGLFSNTATGLTYDSVTGITSLTSGYVIPLSASTTEWSDFYNTPSTRITAGANLAWSGNTLIGTFGTSSARASISENATGLDYDSGTGVLSLTSGYTIPLTASTTEWSLAYASSTSLTPSYIRGLFSNTATGLTYNSSTGATSLTAGYVIPLSASTTEWTNFYNTPSTRITAGNGLAWTGNSIGIDGPVSVGNGGTGATSLTGILLGNGTSPFTATTSLSSAYIEDAYVRNIGDTMTGNLVMGGTAANIALGSNWLSGDGDDEGIFVGALGHVGIGTSSPAFRLDIVQSSNDFGFRTSDGTTEAVIGISSTNTGLFGTRSNNDTQFITNNTIRATIASNGNFGIGDTSPASLLSVGAGDAFQVSATGTVTSGTWNGSDIDISEYTNLSVGNGVTLTGDVLTVTAAGGLAQTIGGLTTTGVLEDLNTLGAPSADGEFIVATGAGAFAYESGATVRTSLGLGSLATLNTINNSNWSGTALEVGNGGTGATSLTGLVIGNGTSAMTATTTSAGLANTISDETGTGSLVFSAAPTFTGNTTLANASTTNLSVSGNSYLGTVLNGTWNGTDIDISDYTNLGVTATGLELSGDNIALTSGYTIPLSASTTEWSTAYSWGDHSLAGYLTSYTETDPIFTASAASGITGTNITNWNAAYASTTAMTPSYLRGLFSNTATGLTYNSSTGATSLTSGYIIPLSASTTEWTSFYNTPSSRITAGTGLTWNINTLSVSTSTLGLDAGFFAQGGNSFGTTGTLGTNDANNLAFETNNSTRMTVTSGGNVGIGTTTPAQKLQVVNTGGQSLTFGDTTAGAGILKIEGGSERLYVRTISDGNALAYSDWGLAVKTTTGITTGKPVDWYFSMRKDGYFSNDTSGPTLEFYAGLKGGGYISPMQFKSNGDILLAAAKNVVGNGNVGIGSSTPSSKLTVQGDAWIGGNVTATGTIRFTDVTSGVVYANANGVLSATSTLSQGAGGTGISSYSVGDILYVNSSSQLARLPVGSAGQVLKVSAGLPSWGIDQTVGEGGGDGVWATSTAFIYPQNTSNTVVVGNSATSTANSIFEVTGNSYFSSNVGIGDTSPVALLTVGSSDAFQVNSSGAIAAATGINSSGVITFSSLTGGLLRVNGSGVVSTTTIDISGDTNLGVTATGLELSGDNIALTSGYVIPLSASTTEWSLAYASTTAMTPSYLRGLFSNTATGLTYDSATGITSLTSGYVIPLSASTTEWANFYDTPSSRITAGDALSWSGNTMNLDISELAAETTFESGDYLAFYDATAGGIRKVNYDDLPGAGGGVTSINGLTNAIQTFATSSNNGLVLNITSSGSTHTFAPSLAAGYTIPLSASTTEWANFYDTPSSRITAGDGISWSANTLNLDINELTTETTFETGDFLAFYDATAGLVRKVSYDNLPGAGGSLTSLNGLTAATQTFATSSDTNIGINIVSSGSTHTFTPTWTGTLAVARGGTGAPTLTGLVVGNGTGAMTATTTSAGLAAVLSNETGTGSVVFSASPTLTGNTTLANASSTNLTVSTNSYLGTVRSGTWNGSTIGETYGGTGQTTYATGDILYASGSNTLAKRTIGSTGDILLVSGGVPTWTATSSLGLAASFFQQNGNSFGTTATLGTNDSQSLAFETNNSTRMTITSTGNVGIGSTTPSSRLTVSGNAFFGGNLIATGTVQFTGITNGFLVADSSGNVTASSTLSTSFIPDAYLLNTGDTATGDYNFDNSTLFVNSVNNRIGIGTSSPRQPLEISASNGGTIRLSDTANQFTYWDIGISPNYSYSDLIFSSNGSERFRVNAAGKFCIGYNGAAGCGGSGSGLIVNGSVGLGTTTQVARLSVQSTGTADIMNLFETGGQEVFTVLESGNVGIGTTSPSSALNIYRNNSNSLLTVDASGLGDAGLAINQTGSGTNDAFVSLRAGVNTFVMGIDNSDGDAFKISETAFGSGDRFVIADTGNVGIGTTTPSYALTVAGDTNQTGALRFGGNAGTTGQILLSNGSSAPTWTATSSLGLGASFFEQNGNSFGTTATLGTNDAQNLAFETGGTTRVTIASTTGNVGIGTVSPAQALEVVGRIQVSNATGGADSFTIQPFTDGYTYLNAFGAGAGEGGFKFRTNDGGDESMVITHTGNVGIGTTSPSSKLDVIGDIEGDTFIVTGSVPDSTNISLGAYAGGAWLNTPSGTNGYLGVGGTGVFRWGASSIVINDGGADFDFRVESDTNDHALFMEGSTGNVGIGTSTPGYALTVAGDTNQTGALRFAGNAGTTGQILLSNGSSAPTWTATSSLGLGASFFQQNGNSFGTTATLGTNDSNNLAFETGGTTRVTIDTAGNVGIGTTNQTSYDAAANNLVVYEAGDGGITVAGGTTNKGSLTFADGISGSAYRGGIQYNHSTDKLQLWSNGLITSTPEVTLSNGNVGIGTTTPAQKLQVVNTGGQSLTFGDTTAGAGILKIEGGSERLYVRTISNGDSSAYSDWGLAVKDTSGITSGKPVDWYFSMRKDGYFSNDTSGPTLEFYSGLKGGGYISPMQFKSNGDILLAAAKNVVGNGNVGIGSSTPSSKLTVQGNTWIGGNVTATGTLAITGAATLGSTLNVTGQTTLANASSTNLTVSTNSYLGTVRSGTWNGSTIGETYGGTGQTTYATGDILYASGSNTLAKRTIGSAGDILLVSGGVPTWTATSSLGLGASFFQQNGNSFGTTATLGTNDANNLAFETSGTARMTILSSGNVGVGDDTPASLFTVGAGDAFQVNSSGVVLAGTWNGSDVDISDYTNLSVSNGITLTGDVLSVTAAGGLAQTTGGLTTTGVLEDLNTLGAPSADGEFIVATGAGTFAYESGATVRTSLGLVAGGDGDIWVEKAGDTMTGGLTMSGSAANIALGSNYLSGDGGDEGIYVTSTGNVGIGTSSPDTTRFLTVERSSGTNTGVAIFRSTLTNAAADVVIVDADNAANRAALQIQGNGGSTEVAFFGSNGNVGIGTTSPAARLHVLSTTEQLRLAYDTSSYWTDTIDSFGNRTMAGNGTGGSLNIDLYGGATGDFSVNSDDFYVDTSSGNVGVGTTTPIWNFAVESSSGLATLGLQRTSYRFANLYAGTTYSGINFDSAGYFAIGPSASHSGTTNTSLVVAGGGNVGIGTTTPSHLFTVAGDTNQTGALRFGGNAGTTGQILLSNGSSAPTWTATSSLGLGASFFQQNGNSFGTTATLGTNDAQNLAFETNNSTRMTVTSSGNVGIGTNAPITLLTISTSTADTNGEVLTFRNTDTVMGANQGYGRLSFYGDDGSTSSSGERAYIYAVSDATGTTGQAELAFGTNSGGATLAERMRISASGNVGIGTSSPTAVVDVWQRNTSQSGLNVQGFANNAVPVVQITGGSSPNTRLVAVTGTQGEVFTITNSTVGIGTTTPTAKLQVLSTSEQLRLSYNTSSYWTDTIASDGGRTMTGFGTDGDLDIVFTSATDGDFSINTDDLFVDTSAGGLVGLGTASPAAKLTVNEASNATKTTFTQAVASAGILINTNYTGNNYTPGLFWNTSDNNATKPKGGIYLQETGTGTYMYFGTSNNYGTGITNDGIIIDPAGGVTFTNASTTNLTVSGNSYLTGAVALGSTLSVTGQSTFNDDVNMGTGDQVKFANETGDKLNLYSNTYGIGIESSTLTSWSGSNHRWRIGGTSVSAGTQYMLLNNTGLTVTGSVDASVQFLGQASDTVSAPSFSWTGDTNVGMYRPTTDTIGFTTAGAEAMRIDSSGNVGIGTTTTSAARLTVNSGSDITAVSMSSSNQYGTTFSLANTHGASAYEYAFYTSGTNSGFGDDKFVIRDVTAAVGRFAIDSSGNTGIGTTTTTNRLTVALGTNEIAQLNDGASGSAIWGMNIGLISTGSEAAISSRSTTPIVFYTGGTLNSVTKGTERMRIDSSGNVGIGSTTPSSRLTVSGNAFFGGNLIATGTVQFTGITGGFLVADNAGNVTASSTLSTSFLPDAYLLNTGDTATGDYNFDSNTFVIDSANNRVGIGTSSPIRPLDVQLAGGAGTYQAQFYNPTNTTGATAGFNLGTASGWNIFLRTNQNNGWFEIANGSGGVQHRWHAKDYMLASDGKLLFSSESNFATGGISTGDTNLFRDAANVLRTNDSLIVDGNVGIGTTTPSAKLQVTGTAGSGDIFAIASSTNTRLFTVTAAGYVGVGDSTPSALLTVGNGDLFQINDSGQLTIAGAQVTYSAATKNIIANNTADAWTIATSSSATPLISITTTTGSEMVTIGKKGGDVYIGDVGSASNLVFEESSTIHGQGGNTLTFGQTGDKINFAVNIGIGSSTPSYPITHSSGAFLSVGGTWTNASDRNLKENLTELDGAAILDKIKNLDITEWNYIAEGTSTRHIGPMAQDFYAAFRLGDNDRSITTVDASGVALAGIKELAKKIDLLTLSQNASSTILASLDAPSTSGILHIIKDWLADLGISFTRTLARFGNVAASALTIGSEDQPNGITLFDRRTGEAYCVLIEDGEMVHEPGACKPHDEPEIELNGESVIELEIGDTYDDAGAKAEDWEGEILPVEIFVNDVATSSVSVDTSVAGEYRIVYVATDRDGLSASTTRSVLVGISVENSTILDEANDENDSGSADNGPQTVAPEESEGEEEPVADPGEGEVPEVPAEETGSEAPTEPETEPTTPVDEGDSTADAGASGSEDQGSQTSSDAGADAGTGDGSGE